MQNDLISKQKVIEIVEGYYEDAEHYGFASAIADIAEAVRMLDVAYSVEKVVEGEWEDEQYIWKCNQCHEWLMLEDGTADMNYCPHCGAKMVGGKE